MIDIEPTFTRDTAGRICTARLRLRAWADRDREAWAAMNADPRVRAHFPTLLTRAEADAAIDRQLAVLKRVGFCFWAVERVSDRAFLGFTGLLPVDIASPIQGEVEIGWRFARNHWGQGYATEAARAALGMAFRHFGLTRVVAMAVPRNAASLAVMARIGMRPAPELDFDHPHIAPGHPLSRHVVHVIDQPVDPVCG